MSVVRRWVKAAEEVFKVVALWRRVRPFRRWKERRALKRGQPLEVQMDVLQGKKSWIGMVAMLLGVVLKLLGVGECSAEALAAAACVPADTLVQMFVATLDQILIAVGGVVTLWGVAMKEMRERKLKAQLEAANTPAPPQP